MMFLHIIKMSTVCISSGPLQMGVPPSSLLYLYDIKMTLSDSGRNDLIF